MNYFELFNIPISFYPDLIHLKTKFYELSRKFHPDFFTQENETDQLDALEMSSLVNKAYKVFQSRDETIKYVLQLNGMMMEEDEKYVLPSDFLMDMMDLNEQLMEATMEINHAEIEKVKQGIATKQHEIELPVKSLMEDYKDGENNQQYLGLIKEYYFKKKYLNRILATIA